MIKSVKHFRPYIYGWPFKLMTDHASLAWLCRRHEPSCQVARWLEILSEFQYRLEHRAGTKHGNADGLSRRPCLECKQCASIEQRDGGPTRKEMLEELESQSVPLSVRPTSPAPGRIDRFKYTSSAPPVEFKSTQSEVSGVQESATDKPGELAQQQRQGDGPVATIYQAVRAGTTIPEDEAKLGPPELRWWCALQPSMKIQDNGVLMVRVMVQGKPRWCAACPNPTRTTVIWDTHALTHAGVTRTISRLRLTWYWPGMTADVRRIVHTCEVCQVAKTGGTRAPTERQKLYAGRPWQKVAVDLVGPMPTTPRGSQWILVLTDHFTRWQDALAIPDATAPTVATILDERVLCYLGLSENFTRIRGPSSSSTSWQSSVNYGMSRRPGPPRVIGKQMGSWNGIIGCSAIPYGLCY